MGGPEAQPTRAESAHSSAAFYREGEYWTLAFAGTVCRLRDAKGLHCVAHLLRHPGEKFGAVELLAVTDAPRSFEIENIQAPSANAEDARVLVTKRIRAAVKKIQAFHPSLGHHLSTCIKTGGHCVYVPDPERPPAWTTE